MTSEYFSKCIKNNIPFVYCKFGDGEYLCMSKNNHNNNTLNHNCDNDMYTDKLSKSLIKSLYYIVNNVNNYYIGEWYDQVVKDFYLSITKKQINYTSYHSFLFDDSDLKKNIICTKLDIFNKIKKSKLKKIYVCNYLMEKAKILLDIDNMIYVPFNNWFDDYYEIIIGQIKSILTQNECVIIMTSCGMGAKVLIADLYKDFPKNIYIDIGSGLDIICTKKKSRGWNYDYDDLFNKFVEFDSQFNLIPKNWDDDKYNYIYEISKKKLGVHI